MDLKSITKVTDINSSVIRLLVEIIFSLEKNIPNTVGLVPPVKPISATIGEYNEYVNKHAEYDRKFLKKQQKIKKLESKKKEINRIVRLLPINIWFMNDEQTHAIANYRRDWGGGQYETYAEKSKNCIKTKLSELKP